MGLWFKSMEEVCGYLKNREGNILFTTGVNEIPNIVKIIHKNRIFARVLPVKSSITIINKSQILVDQIITKKPPFSLEDNIKHIVDFNIEYLVTKDSGAEGNILEKLEAVKEKNISLLVIDRPKNKYNIVYYKEVDIINFVETFGDENG